VERSEFYSYFRIYHALLSYLFERFIIFVCLTPEIFFHVGLGDSLIVLRDQKQDMYILLLTI
jgi:hypothetical protein